MADSLEKQEYIPAEVYEAQLAARVEDRMVDVTSRDRLPRELTRKSVVNSFLTAFDMIGGVPALAEWGSANRTEFYRLYSKMAPSAHSDNVASGTLVIKHVIPPSPLDE